MRGESHGNATFRPPQSCWYATITTRQDQGQWPGPETRGEMRSVRRQVQIESCHLLWIADEQQKGLAGRPPFHAHQGFNRLVINGGAEPVYSFCWIREYSTLREVHDRCAQCPLDLSGRPERYRGASELGARHACYSVSMLRASARAKSASSVIFMPRSLPRTTTTSKPRRSQRAASSVAPT